MTFQRLFLSLTSFSHHPRHKCCPRCTGCENTCILVSPFPLPFPTTAQLLPAPHSVTVWWGGPRTAVARLFSKRQCKQGRLRVIVSVGGASSHAPLWQIRNAPSHTENPETGPLRPTRTAPTPSRERRPRVLLPTTLWDSLGPAEEAQGVLPGCAPCAAESETRGV